MLAATDLTPLTKKLNCCLKVLHLMVLNCWQYSQDDGDQKANMKSSEEAGRRAPHVEAQREIDPELLNFCQQTVSRSRSNGEDNNTGPKKTSTIAWLWESQRDIPETL